jgi:hypothetical protein
MSFSKPKIDPYAPKSSTKPVLYSRLSVREQVVVSLLNKLQSSGNLLPNFQHEKKSETPSQKSALPQI